MAVDLQAIGPVEYNPSSPGVIKAPEGPQVLVTDEAKDLYLQFNDRYLQYLRIQNLSAVGPIKVALNEEASANVFNLILPVDTAQDAGNGGVLVIPGSWGLPRVSIITNAASGRFSIIRVTREFPVRVTGAVA